MGNPNNYIEQDGCWNCENAVCIKRRIVNTHKEIIQNDTLYCLLDIGDKPNCELYLKSHTCLGRLSQDCIESERDMIKTDIRCPQECLEKMIYPFRDYVEFYGKCQKWKQLQLPCPKG